MWHPALHRPFVSSQALVCGHICQAHSKKIKASKYIAKWLTSPPHAVALKRVMGACNVPVEDAYDMLSIHNTGLSLYAKAADIVIEQHSMR